MTSGSKHRLQMLLLAATLTLAFNTRAHEMARAFIPSPRNVHGEVRVISDGNATRVQSLLYSRMLARGLQAIRNKESESWPQGQPDSARYLDALRKAERQVLDAFYATTNRVDERQTMLIEVAAFPDHGEVRICELQLAETNGTVTILSSPVLESFTTSLDYARSSMRRIIRNAFPEIPPELKPVLSALAGDEADEPTAAVPLHE